MPAQLTDEARTAVFKLADDCRQCFQCGQCIGACPSGFDLDHGPRRIVRLILAGEVAELLTAEDVWRCSECRACSDACPMEVDTAGMMAAVRDLQREHDSVRCPERTAADIAEKRLAGSERIDNMAFGMAMAGKGHVPKDSGRRRRRDDHGQGHAAPRRGGGTPSRAGSQALLRRLLLQQDKEAFHATARVARDLGFPLAEQAGAGCCGHGSRGKVPSRFESDDSVFTVCPACDHSLQEVGIETEPVWQALVERAGRAGLKLKAAAPRFVPYVGCLTDRETALDSLAGAAELAGSRW